MHFAISLLSPLGKGCVPSFFHHQRMLCAKFVEIGLVVFELKMKIKMFTNRWRARQTNDGYCDQKYLLELSAQMS